MTAKSEPLFEPLAGEFRRTAALLGFLLKAEIDAIFKQQPFKTADGEDPVDLWRKLDRSRQSLNAVADGQITALPESLTGLEAAVRQRKTYKHYYEAVADYSFGSVPIESLLAPQWSADLDYVEEMAAKLKPDLSPEEQLNFALSEGTIHQPIVAGNQVLFTSARRDLHADPIPTVRKITEGEYEIVTRAVSRPNYVQVAKIGSRLLLTNGVHKVCALYKAGFTHCYCLVREVHDISETGLNTQSTMFRAPVFNSARPALVIDLINSNTAATLYIRSMYQILQVTINAGTMTIPALPKK